MEGGREGEMEGGKEGREGGREGRREGGPTGLRGDAGDHGAGTASPALRSESALAGIVFC